MRTITLATQNDKVRQVDAKVRAKFGDLADRIFAYLNKIDPDRMLALLQAREIERLQERLLAKGMILSHVEIVWDKVLREFNRLRAEGVDVDLEVVEAVRGCLVERDDG